MPTIPSHTLSALQALLMAAASFSNLADEDFTLERHVIGGMSLGATFAPIVEQLRTKMERQGLCGRDTVL
ncbi:hypothetical protein [Corynebacterium mayonis]|uniref:hypothetical protein n=1 Tax=Corynebacterium mayonis TaxID=3062461 RepID=UPI00313FFEF9